MAETKGFIKYAINKKKFCANNPAIKDMDNFIGIICCMGGKIMMFLIHVFKFTSGVGEEKRKLFQSG